MNKYFINWSPYTGNYLVKRIGDGKILQIFEDKRKAEEFIKELEEKEYGKK